MSGFIKLEEQRKETIVDCKVSALNIECELPVIFPPKEKRTK